MAMISRFHCSFIARSWATGAGCDMALAMSNSRPGNSWATDTTGLRHDLFCRTQAGHHIVIGLFASVSTRAPPSHDP
eukprot:CAMPEP_0118969780 /NCGR_PEP_ID=MMETSP1173-20130426/6821_1 /TAXON_ID=1034831 /ORGANISM="Rhizochromulina marina cf, Strain CCMP1243" /LENGTH=76 /DNA_ID=CAMNT_0006919061 /DNA_START=64 /DNA_END=294 /DNA_ORIENTATION=+